MTSDNIEMTESRDNQYPRILIIGNLSECAMTKDALSSLPYQFQCFTSNRKAIVEILRAKPYMLIYNESLPELNGNYFYQELTECHGEKCLPVILLREENRTTSPYSFFQSEYCERIDKPYMKHELLLKVQALSDHVQTKNRFSRLGVFSKKIAKIRDLDTLLYSTYTFLLEEPMLADVTLISENGIRYSNSANRADIKNAYTLISRSLETEDCQFALKKNGQYLFLKVNDEANSTFAVRFTGCHFSSIDREYLKHIVGQTNIIQDNMQVSLCDHDTIMSLYEIISKRNQVLFIKSAKQYVELYAKQSRPQLLCISLKKVSLYLKDHLIKVHRSYLVNPNEIQQMKKRQYGRYEILMHNHSIPVGEVYLPSLREKCGHWFHV